MSAGPGYVSFRVGKRVLLAWPDALGRQARRRYLRTMQADTPRKRWAIRVLKSAVALGGDRWLMPDHPVDPAILDVLSDTSLNALASRHGLTGPRYVLGFPAIAERGRCYATMVDSGGTPRVFVKVARTESAVSSLEDEVRALSLLETMPRPFDVPRVEAFSRVGRAALLAMGVAPAGGHPVGESELLALSEEWQAMLPPEDAIDGGALRERSWWQRYKALEQGTAALHRDLNEILTRPVCVGVAHGDFGPGNARRADGRCFVFDWEYFDQAAPAWTDACQLWIACRQRAVMARPLQSLHELAATYDVRYRGFMRRLPLCLAFLAGCGSREARQLINVWPGQNALASAMGTGKHQQQRYGR